MAERDPLTALYNRRSFDAVLRAISVACASVVRAGDCLARIGGAEFPNGLPAVRASFAWAVAPADARGGQELLDRADQRLLYRKRLNKRAI